MVRFYNKKLVVSGDIFELYEYEKEVFYDYKGNPSGRSSSATYEDREKNREKVLNRARRDLRRIINVNIGKYANITSKFVSFTFAENVIDLGFANKEWRKFIKRLNRYFDKDIKYVVVPEFQERGAVHYHAVFFNMPYIPARKLFDIWGHGFVKINKIDDVDNVGAYICKYMRKQSVDDRLSGKKSYFCSRGLYKPKEITDKNKIDELVAHLSQMNCCTYDKVFTNDYNNIHYRQYNINKMS